MKCDKNKNDDDDDNLPWVEKRATVRKKLKTTDLL